MEYSEKIVETSTKLDVHLAECALRYENLEKAFSRGDKKMDQLQWMIVGLALIVMFGPKLASELTGLFVGK